MDTSSLVAAVTSGVIFAFAYVTSVFYLFGYDRKNNEISDEKSHVYKWTFHVESLRFYGMLNLLIVLTGGAIVTENSGIDTIEDPTETVIFELFGMNHSCNWVDHNPVRMIASILILPFVQIPFMLYIVFWHCRLAKSVKTGKSPKWLLNASRVLSPFNFISMSQLHLWFVNNPNDTYGFIAHYIPYLMFQIALCVLKLLNMIYLTYKEDLPWGIPKGLAGAYIALFFGVTVMSMVFVISTLAGIPIITATDSPGELLFTKVLSFSWAALAVVGTIILSGKERLNGDNLTLTIGDNMFELESSPEDVEAQKALVPKEEANEEEEEAKEETEEQAPVQATIE